MPKLLEVVRDMKALAKSNVMLIHQGRQRGNQIRNNRHIKQPNLKRRNWEVTKNLVKTDYH